MHFSFKKTLSLLHIHRRSKSDGASVDVINPLPRSHSLTEVNDLSLDFLNDVLPTAHPHASMPITMPVGPMMKTSPEVNHAKSSDLQIRLLALEEENTNLKEEIVNLRLGATAREEELVKFRGDYYAERFKTNVQQRVSKAEADQLKAQSKKFEQSERFVNSILQLGIQEPVFARAWDDVLKGEDAEDALVDSIKLAAAKPGSPWSRILPAVIGPRSPEDYVAAINLTLKTRKDLRKKEKVADFWKLTAKQDPAHSNVITPSPSCISEINESFGNDRGNAVDDFLKRLCDGEIPTKKRTLSKPEISSTSCPMPATREVASVSRPPNLSPLASQIFKDELIASHSSSRLSISSCTQSRSILGDIDINRSDKSLRETASMESARLSAQSLEKRKAAVVADNISAQESHSSSVTSLARHGIVKPIIPAIEVPIVSPLPIHELFKSEPDVTQLDNGFTPERALLSLERICAGFSSGSLGSLDTIDEEPPTEITITLGSGSIVVSDRSSTLLSDQSKENTSDAPPITAFPNLEATRSINRKSRLPVFENLRRLSSSMSPSKKTSLIPKPSPPPPSVQRPTTSSILKTSPVKKTLVSGRKTPPLRVAKKSKVPVAAPPLPTNLSTPKSRIPLSNSRIPNVVPPITTNSRVISKSKRAVRTLSRIIS